MMNLVDEVGTLLDTTSPIFESYAEAYCTEVWHLNPTEIWIYILKLTCIVQLLY